MNISLDLGTIPALTDGTNRATSSPERETSMLLTKEIKNTIRKADSVCFDFYEIPGLERYERDKKEVTIRCAIRPNGHQGPETRIEFEKCSGRIGNGSRDKVQPRSDGEVYDYSRDADNTYEPKRGTWVMLCARQQDHLQSIFRLIPTGSELHIEVRLDYGSNAYCVRNRLHVDQLVIRATPIDRRGKRLNQLEFLLDSSVGEHNTARFGNGRWE